MRAPCIHVGSGSSTRTRLPHTVPLTACGFHDVSHRPKQRWVHCALACCAAEAHPYCVQFGFLSHASWHSSAVAKIPRSGVCGPPSGPQSPYTLETLTLVTHGTSAPRSLSRGHVDALACAGGGTGGPWGGLLHVTSAGVSGFSIGPGHAAPRGPEQRHTADGPGQVIW